MARQHFDPSSHEQPTATDLAYEFEDEVEVTLAKAMSLEERVSEVGTPFSTDGIRCLTQRYSGRRPTGGSNKALGVLGSAHLNCLTVELFECTKTNKEINLHPKEIVSTARWARRHYAEHLFAKVGIRHPQRMPQMVRSGSAVM